MYFGYSLQNETPRKIRGAKNPLFHSFIIRTIPSVREFHPFGGMTPFADYTAGGELHSAPKNIRLPKLYDAIKILSSVFHIFYFKKNRRSAVFIFIKYRFDKWEISNTEPQLFGKRFQARFLFCGSLRSLSRQLPSPRPLSCRAT